ncbi:hypothetical protein BJ742DRAFT_510243 [Cladochytrium replicatum]|nr:hypothetical protein BJ742DRAFT_510243 [Cladochytrium replicatum]
MLSYCWSQGEIIQAVHDELVNLGITVWFDRRQMRGNIYDSMAFGVESSKVFVPFLSEDYSRSYNCTKECRYAADIRKGIVPTLVFNQGPATHPLHQKLGRELAFIIAGLRYIDFFGSGPPARICFDKELTSFILRSGTC